MKSDMDRIPEGWVGLDIYGAYVNPSSNEFILLGNPGEEDGHNCDAMGCSTLDHVLIRVEVPNWQATQQSVQRIGGTCLHKNIDPDACVCLDCGENRPVPANR